MQNKYSVDAKKKIGSSQRSRFFVLIKRIAASGDENELGPNKQDQETLRAYYMKDKMSLPQGFCSWWLQKVILGADYMANFNPGWNFSPPSGWNFVAITWLVSARAEIWNCGEKWETVILFSWKHNRWACPSSLFSPGWNINAITWCFSEFQPGLKFPTQFHKPGSPCNRPGAKDRGEIILGQIHVTSNKEMTRYHGGPPPPGSYCHLALHILRLVLL